MTLHVRAYDHGREEPFRAISTRLARLCAALGVITPELGSWQGKVGSGVIPIASERDAEIVLAASARMWRSGDRELVAYGPSAEAVHLGAVTGTVAMVAGIAPMDLPVWVPNQIDVEIRGAAEAEIRSDPRRVQAVLQALITHGLPAWAVVAIDGVPVAPVPPFADGTPSVGWMTYLSSIYPPLPPLPEPAIVHDVATGVIVVANSSKPDPAAIERVAHALADAKVLLPAAQVRVRPPR